jgi:hypothetical protein
VYLKFLLTDEKLLPQIKVLATHSVALGDLKALFQDKKGEHML